LDTLDFAAVVGGKVKGEGLKELKNPFPFTLLYLAPGD
jgi:hypothetical protein